MQATFHGAAGCVTGSRFLVESGGRRVLVDCGLFQGHKVLRERNWRKPPFDPSSLDAVLLTHAHIDHSGYLPALVRDGFKGPIFATKATRDLCAILLPDSARLKEEDARYANKHGFSKHAPALPLYTEKDADRVAERFHAVKRGDAIDVGGFKARFREAGHILGASSVLIDDGTTKVLFSGDLGREHDVLMRAPAPPPAADWVVMESTYGDRLHEGADPYEAVAAPLRRCIERGGVALVPSFSVGRTQALLTVLHGLFESGQLPRVPVFVDSPMATAVTELYQEHVAEHILTPESCEAVFSMPNYARSVDESKALDRPGPPRIIISASGMVTGGRVLHHLKVFGPGEDNLILLPGFQAPGTRGAAIAGGAEKVKLHGGYVPIRAEVVQLSILSAHADQSELLGWLGRAEGKPKGVVLVHGEPDSLDVLRLRVKEDLAIPVQVADHGETLDLAASGAQPS
ncbi:MAG TPA: MBL fold metallo-hydrolase [Planctomycetota bacterium]